MAGRRQSPADENLRKIDHVVVLMMENRSFDHMLGFLTIEQGRGDIEGPSLAMKNDYRGESYHVHPATRTTMNKAQDPCHSGWCVDEQLQNGNGGFVSNFMKTRKTGGGNPGVVMAYHTAAQLPVYSYLADQFCVCDHWFCSVPGATMPNRCYAVAGTSNGLRDNLKPTRPYNLPSFCRHLKNDQWRWYSHDYVPMIWLIDPDYGLAVESVPAYFNQRDVFGQRSFLERAAAGDLPPLSWIDPNFIDLTFGPAGFYDHLPPPKAADDRPAMRRYGPRVPALVVSPFVGKQAVSKVVFDHTSLTKTILARFAAKPDEAIKKMGARVAAAKHLGELLTEDNPRPAPARADYQTLLDQAASWHEQLVHNGAREQIGPGGLAVPHELSDWQQDFLGAKQELLAARRQLAAAGKDVF